MISEGHAAHDNGAARPTRQALLSADSALAAQSATLHEEQVAVLIECSLVGEDAAFALLVERYAGAVYNLAYRNWAAHRMRKTPARRPSCGPTSIWPVSTIRVASKPGC